MRGGRLTQRDLDDIRIARTAWQNRRGQKLREDALLNQDEVASRLSTDTHPVTRSAVGMWETGARIPSGPRALAYGRFLRGLGAERPAAGDLDREPDAIAAAV